MMEQKCPDPPTPGEPYKPTPGAFAFACDGFTPFRARVIPATTTTVRFEGELDHSVDHVAQEAIEAALRIGTGAVVIDLSALVFMDSTGVARLLAVQAAAEDAGRRLALRLGPAAERMMDLCGVLPRFDVVA